MLLGSLFVCKVVIIWGGNIQRFAFGCWGTFYFSLNGLFLGTIIFFLSYQCRSNRNLFRMQLASYLCYMTHMFLLGALTGGTSYILNVVRNFWRASDASLGNYFYLALWLEKFRPGRRDWLNSKKALQLASEAKLQSFFTNLIVSPFH